MMSMGISVYQRKIGVGRFGGLRSNSAAESMELYCMSAGTPRAFCVVILRDTLQVLG